MNFTVLVDVVDIVREVARGCEDVGSVSQEQQRPTTLGEVANLFRQHRCCSSSSCRMSQVRIRVNEHDDIVEAKTIEQR